MRKKGISPEYIYIPVPGSLNMHESRSFLGSKMMYTEDSVYLDSRDIVYYQQSNGEQIDLTQELNLDTILYSITTDKSNNSQFGMDPDQSEQEMENKTKWVMEVDLREILKNYVYANIKNNRTFEGVRNQDTQYKSVNEAIYKYIDNNIIDRYEYSNIEFFVKYIELNENSSNRFQTNYDPSIEEENNVFTDIRIVFTEDKSMARIYFTQQEDSKEYTFDYYFNIIFIKK